ncbi:MAG: hypothetical protein PHX34_00140 [Candidatus Shapirobacteria bacterium]|nr:hypothetical protein [Candidatus Shapirobacteria bacterium]
MINSQTNLIEKLNKLSRIPNGIVLGETDIHGRKFTPDGHFFTPDGQFSPELQSFIDKLSDQSIRDMIEAGIMYYDIRSQFWKENPELTVIFALAYAKKLVEKSGKTDGNIVFIGVDAYQKHFDAAQIFVDTILRTGICDNGGGVYFWGVLNGGDIRNYSQLFHAVNQEGGNWVFFTMSHRVEDFLGCKMGMNAVVYCGSEIRHCEGVTSGTFFDAVVEKDFSPIKNFQVNTDNLINISSTLNNNIQVAADMVRATSAPQDINNEDLFKGLKIGVNMGGSPILLNLIQILKSLGADVIIDNESLDVEYSTANIVDPNEHHSEAIEKIKNRALETNHIWLSVDPDGDRGSLVDINSKGEAVSLTGSELLLLTIENLAKSYKAKNIIPTIICDMRTSVSAKDLEKILNDKNFPVRVVPHEAGYPFFMKGMASLPADVAVENTCHEFTNPMTNPNWGAPANHSFPGYQGGDNAALYLIYILGCIKYAWENRTPCQQLDWIRNQYSLKETFVDEKKPSLPVFEDKYKYFIADKMKQLAKDWFIDPSQYLINFGDPKVTLLSGVHLTNVQTKAMTLVRFSNTGSSFTISGEAYSREDLDDMLGLGFKLLITAVKELNGNITTKEDHDQNGTPKNKDFSFFENDASIYQKYLS